MIPAGSLAHFQNVEQILSEFIVWNSRERVTSEYRAENFVIEEPTIDRITVEQTNHCFDIYAAGPSRTTSPTSCHSVASDQKTTVDTFSCAICEEDFDDPVEFNNHVMTHSKKMRYSCSQCDKSFVAKQSLTRHMMTHTGRLPHFCDICGRGCTDISVLKDHKKTHMNEKPFSCEVCNKSFKRQFNLKAHAKIHEKTSPFSCSICYRRFNFKVNYKKHLREHVGSKENPCRIPLVCPSCGKEFPTIKTLNKHMKQHLTPKPESYPCTICGRSYRFLSSLSRHQEWHENQNTYDCTICGKTLTRRDSLVKHMRTQHTIGSFSTTTEGTILGNMSIVVKNSEGCDDHLEDQQQQSQYVAHVTGTSMPVLSHEEISGIFMRVRMHDYNAHQCDEETSERGASTHHKEYGIGSTDRPTE
ncbi:hypothetical protein QAD02_008894 [Eretmocerus hayati]|uniref:Uncharacterized protein n=1 Tax=Eretmocerus hayati TaxID=131215 RepID=A0ACC2N7X2_9HYME|nr:hypothetical protein QAD02_008894 [Eretmocerus hayati]